MSLSVKPAKLPPIGIAMDGNQLSHAKVASTSYKLSNDEIKVR